MFDRGRNERAGPVGVEIGLRNGHEIKGKIAVPPGLTLVELLNGSANFVEFETFTGERTFIAKSALLTLKPLDQTPAPTLGIGKGLTGSFDPHVVLGVGPDASKEKIRQAYISLAKIYHPDRYATVDLPAEVSDYLSAMVRRINVAYDALEAAPQRGAGASDATRAAAEA
jgi:hypothetical protein